MATQLTLNTYWNVFELCSNRVCLDIGANDGSMTEKILENGATKVYCFEPGKVLCETIRRKFAGNDKIVVVETGLSDEIGELKNVTWLNAWLLGNPADIKFPVSPGACDIEGYDFIDVQLNTVDNYFKDSDEEIGFMKIDVDGYDYKVLKGSQTILDKYRPIIFIELSCYYDVVKGSSVDEFLEFVTRNNYTCISLDGYIRSIEFVKQEFPYHSSCDIFLCPTEKLDLFKQHIR